MAKLLSGLTLLVALAATFFGFQSKELVGKLQETARRDHTDLEETRAKLKKADEKMKTGEEDVRIAKEELSKAQLDLTAAKTDLEKAKTDLAAAEQKQKTAETLLAELNKTYEEFKAKFGGKTPEEIAKIIADLEVAKKDLDAKVVAADIVVTELKSKNDSLTSQKNNFDEKLASQRKVIDRYQKNIMQKGVRGRVLAVNSGWGFCVLSIGDRQGAAANKTMVVARDGQAIGKVKITNVEASQSVADILPSSFVRGTYVRPGDEVIFTGEDKVREEPEAPAGNTPAGPTLPGVPELPKL